MNELNEQVTVRLSPELGRALREAARRMQRKPSDVVRVALREYLALPGPDGARPADRVRSLLGSVDSRGAVIESVKRGR